MTGDTGFETIARRADIARSRADETEQLDGPGAKPRLDLDILGPVVTPRAGQEITVDHRRQNRPALVRQFARQHNATGAQ